MSLDLNQIVSLIVKNVNSFGIKTGSVSLAEEESSKDGAGTYAVTLKSDDVRIASGILEGVLVDDAAITIQNVKVGGDTKAMAAALRPRIDHLLVKVSDDLINSFLTSQGFLDELQRSAPAEVRGLRMLFADGKVSIRGEVRKFITVPFTIDLRFQAVENCLRVVFANFTTVGGVSLPDAIRRLIMSFAEKKLKSIKSLEGLVSIADDYVVINPWPKVPMDVNAKFMRFGVEGRYFILEMGPDENYRPASEKAEAPAPVPEAPKAAPKLSPEEEMMSKVLPVPPVW